MCLNKMPHFLLKVSTIKFLDVFTFNDNVNKASTKICKSVCVMRRLHCQLPVDEMVKLYYYLVYCYLTYDLLPYVGEDRDVLMLLRLSVLTGEHQITQRLQPKDCHFSFNLWVLCFIKAFNTNTLNFHHYFKG